MRKQAEVRKSRNMSRYPIVLKDYGIVAYFARGFRYNEQALVYSGLLADEREFPRVWRVKTLLFSQRTDPK